MIRQAVRDLEALGKFPPSETVDDELLRRHEELLMSITRPLSPEEALVLVKLFGVDTYYGLAWAMLHLIESTPGWPLENCLASMESDVWQKRIRERIR